MNLFRAAAVVLAALASIAAAPATKSNYDPSETFAPFSIDPQPNRYRSGSGLPGPDYWQNRADYTISARLDPLCE